MIAAAGAFFADRFRRWIPDSFVFALLLTFMAGALALVVVDDVTPVGVLDAWQKGFWSLLAFGMQMVLILATGYAIAISPPAARVIDVLVARVRSPVLVYALVTGVGCLFSLVSWGWIVLTAVMARELAARVRGVDYRLLAACVYVSFLTWHGGLSGSIPLVLNTPDNFLITSGVLSATIPVARTIASPLNLVCNATLVLTLPLLMVLMRPRGDAVREMKDLRREKAGEREISVEEEARALRLPTRNLSDALNHSRAIQWLISAAGVWWLARHFRANGFDVNLNVMNVLFLMLGLLAHGTPARYVVAMQRACGNVSGIVLQFPFYAGIMGILQHTGLGSAIATALAAGASAATLPPLAFLIGGVVNLFIPSGGGEWAVVGPSLVEAARSLGATLPPDQLAGFVARVSMAVAYGDAWTNMIQPFWTLAFFPVIAAGVRLQARDIMGYTFVALLWSGVIFAACVTFLPI
ncbi:MAG: short-chain fatty acid transporter [Gemmatimonadetes bacterium]|nr:short-chain fatty acid transporter [Gemmatimonadota bacterium]